MLKMKMAVSIEKFLSSASPFLLVVLLSFSHSHHASSQSTVRYLPGFNGRLPFHLETGYVGVGELNRDQLFYYFIESERDPKEDPLMVWLTGGPGCSALSGLLFEIGPLNIEYKEYNGILPTLVVNPHSWTKISSIIFVDSPVFTGFSYSEDPKDDKGGDIKSSKAVYEFLRKWLDSHPQFVSNPLYIGGDSYSGLTLPIVVQEIANGKEAGHEPILNLKGYLLGNPWTDNKIDKNAVVPYLHGMGIISDELYESAKKNCDNDYYSNAGHSLCSKDLEKINEFLSEIDKAAILEPNCPFAAPKPMETGEHRRSLEEYSYLLCYYFANNDSARKALHIRKGTVGEWVRCNFGLPYIREITSSIKYHLNLTTKGYRALVYSGDHDSSVPFLGTQAWIRSLNFSIIDEWRSWWVDGQVAGYTRTYANNLTFATVKGGGHTAPEYKPKECFAMFYRWVSNKPL
eukprot:TRINITY_DN4274_c0_g1_i3.p1 TRINITY_DN4274_c0_g1~~TRINITY_DN4274_c0_g1_i3.p1  ORF type:complete len:459 (+),score=55.63 TRINITY_DN4274_c0_g1_i3:260-1636(+)